MKITNVINGWWNLLKQNTVGLKNYFEEQVTERRKICKGCKLNSSGTCSASKSDKHYFTGEITSGCSCPIEAKTTAMGDICPLGKWQEVVDEERWFIIKSLDSYDSIIYDGIMIHNNKDKGFFASPDGKIIIPYLWIEPKLIKKFILIPMDKYIDYNERSFMLNINSNFKDFLDGIEKDNNTDIILWVVNNFGMNDIKLRNCMNFYLSNYGMKNLKFVHTKTNDKNELNEIIKNFNYYYHKSKTL